MTSSIARVASIYRNPDGFRLQTDTVTVRLSDQEAKDLIASALEYLKTSPAGVVPASSLAWLEGRA